MWWPVAQMTPAIYSDTETLKTPFSLQPAEHLAVLVKPQWIIFTILSFVSDTLFKTEGGCLPPKSEM